MKKNTSVQVVQRFFTLLNLDRKEVQKLYFYAVFYGLLTLILPIGVQSVIQLIQSGRPSTSYYLVVVLVLVSIIVAGYIQLLQLRLVENLQRKIFVRYAFEFSYRLNNVDFSKYKNENPTELANRFFETLSLQKGLPKILIDVVGALLQITFGLILLSLYHPVFIAFSLILVVLLILSFQYSGQKGIVYGLKESKYKYKTVFWIQELVRTNKVNRHADPFLNIQQTDENLNQYLAQRENKFQVIWKQFIQLIGFKVFFIFTFFIIGGYLVFQSKMNLGQFIASEIIIVLLISSIEKIVQSLETIYELFASIEKIEQVIDFPLENGRVLTSPVLNDHENRWYFNQVEGELSHIGKISNLKLEGEFVLDRHVLITAQDSIKTNTFLQLILKSSCPKTGHIHINNHPVNSISNESYLEGMFYLDAKRVLFDGDIWTNLTLGRKQLTEKQVIDVLKKVELEAFINGLPEGMNTLTGDSFLFIPNEIIQKIMVARVLLHQPKILISDGFLDQLQGAGNQLLLDLLFQEGSAWHIISISRNKALWPRFKYLLWLPNKHDENIAVLEIASNENKLLKGF